MPAASCLLPHVCQCDSLAKSIGVVVLLRFSHLFLLKLGNQTCQRNRHLFLHNKIANPDYPLQIQTMERGNAGRSLVWPRSSKTPPHNPRLVGWEVIPLVWHNRSVESQMPRLRRFLICLKTTLMNSYIIYVFVWTSTTPCKSPYS